MATFPTPIILSVQNAGMCQAVTPSSLVSDWINVSSGLSLDTAPVYTNPMTMGIDTSLTLPNTKPFHRVEGLGTNIRVRLVYDNAHSAIGTPPAYLLLGRKRKQSLSNLPNIPGDYANGEGGGSAWQYLPNRAGTIIVATAPDLVNDLKFTVGATTLRATTPDASINTHDCDGCNEFWLIPMTAIIATNGTYALDRYETKII